VALEGNGAVAERADAAGGFGGVIRSINSVWSFKKS
jgi:hypothetical protein